MKNTIKIPIALCHKQFKKENCFSVTNLLISICRELLWIVEQFLKLTIKFFLTFSFSLFIRKILFFSFIF